jgi:hypothetical protein
MKWLKFTHSKGVDLLNLSSILRITKTGDTEITIFDNNSILPITFTFDDDVTTNQFFYKLTQVLDTINLDSMAVEYFTRD